MKIKDTSLIRNLSDMLAKLSMRMAKTETATSQLQMNGHVHGMDVYVSDTDPNLDGDYVWINTNVNQFTE